MSTTRRTLLRHSATAALTTLGFPAILRAEGSRTAPLDAAMTTLLGRYGLPGGALGIARAGRLVYAKGFGFANKEHGTQVRPESLFRIASVSKPITAATILRLVEMGRMTLDEPALGLLGDDYLAGGVADARFMKITVRHLLQHAGGWDKARSGDPLFSSAQIARAMGVAAPADTRTTIRYVLQRALDFEPGSRFSYCNFGYCILGRIIEAVTRQSYADAVRSLVLRPSGISRMALGDATSARPGEVSYYQPGESTYGSFSLATNDANGGWVASVADLLRFTVRLDETAAQPLLKPATLQAVYTSVAPGSVGLTGAYHGLGWYVNPKGQGGRPNLWYIGGLPGTKSILTRLGDGFDWVVLLNQRPQPFDASNADIQKTIHKAAGDITEWPTHDLFSSLG